MFFMSAIVLPAMYFLPGKDGGSYENAYEALYMLTQSTLLLGLVIAYVCSIACYNFFGLNVAKQLSTVHRTLIDSLRTTVVWVVDLFIYYVVSNHYGEQWTDYSFIQLGGFLLLICGTLIYNKVLKLPGFTYPE